MHHTGSDLRLSVFGRLDVDLSPCFHALFSLVKVVATHRVSPITGGGPPAQHHLWSSAQQQGDCGGSRRNIWNKQKEWQSRGDGGENLSRHLFLLNRPRNDNNSLADWSSCLQLKIHNSRLILSIHKWDWKKIFNSIFFRKMYCSQKNWTWAIYPQVMAEWQHRCDNIPAVSGMQSESSLCWIQAHA